MGQEQDGKVRGLEKNGYEYEPADNTYGRARIHTYLDEDYSYIQL